MAGPSLRYFAYGSNLFSPRLRARAPSARVVGVAVLPGHALRFHKRGRGDGSGKCNVWRDAAAPGVPGALYEVADPEWADLDAAEGRGSGYERLEVVVVRAGGERVAASTYVAQPHAIDDTLLPYRWYRDLVLAGAREHALPSEHVARIEAQACKEDPDRKRDADARRLLASLPRAAR